MIILLYLFWVGDSVVKSSVFGDRQMDRYRFTSMFYHLYAMGLCTISNVLMNLSEAHFLIFKIKSKLFFKYNIHTHVYKYVEIFLTHSVCLYMGVLKDYLYILWSGAHLLHQGWSIGLIFNKDICWGKVDTTESYYQRR